jgi:hypothetical protein
VKRDLGRLEWWKAWPIVLLGLAILGAAGVLRIHPPRRTTTEKSQFGQITETVTEFDESAVIVALLTTGALLIIYAINGRKIIWAKTPFGELNLSEPSMVSAIEAEASSLTAKPVAPRVQEIRADILGSARVAVEPVRPAAGSAFAQLTEESKKIMRTLWSQQEKHDKTHASRWTFAASPQSPEYVGYLIGLTPLLERALVAVLPSFQCALTSAGIAFMIKVPVDQLDGERYTFG